MASRSSNRLPPTGYATSRLLSARMSTAKRTSALRPISSATSIDSATEVEVPGRKPSGWSKRRTNVLPTAVEQDESSNSDADSFESLSSRAKFMSDMLSDSDSSIDGRISFDGEHTSTTVSSFDGPQTPRTPAPEYTDTGFPMVEIADDKSPKYHSRSASWDVSPEECKLPEMSSTVGPRGPHLFRSYSTSHASSLNITIPSRAAMPPTPSASDGSMSPVQEMSPIKSVQLPQLTPPSEPERESNLARRSEYSQVISEYELEEVRSWTTMQVAVWMRALGFEDELVGKFEKNDITGAILVDLKWEDLKELEIHSFGKRIELWTEIHHLRARTIATPDLPGAEFVRSGSRATRSPSSAKSPRPSPRLRSGSQSSQASQASQMLASIHSSIKSQPAPVPAVRNDLATEDNIISEADEESSEKGSIRKAHRPQLRKKSKRTNVRMPRRQISVDSIIITSDEDAEQFAKKFGAEDLEAIPRRIRSIRQNDGIQPSDSASTRGSRKHKCKKHHHHSAEDGTAAERRCRHKKPHRCSKGDKCPKHGKQQAGRREVAGRINNRDSMFGSILIATTPSIADVSALPRIPALMDSPNPRFSPRPQSYAAPSVLASSDVLGPIQSQEVKLQEGALREIQRVDPLENVKQFLTNQHLQHLEETRSDSPPPVPSKSAEDLARAYRDRHSPPPPPLSLPPPMPRYDLVPPPSSHGSVNGQKTILIPLPPAQAPAPPTQAAPERSQTPSFGLRSQGMERAQPPQHFNFSCPSRLRSPATVLRTTTPFSEADVPVCTPTPVNLRSQSQSVPADLQNRRFPTPDFARRPGTANRPQPLAMSPLDENTEWEAIEEEEGQKMAPSPHLRAHTGWMKKRRTNWFRHEWPDYHFVLRGTRLGYAEDVGTQEVGTIDMDQYQVACSNSASTKLSSAFKIFGMKKNAKLNGQSYFFQLVPANEKSAKNKKELGKVHYFAVGSREERIDWMRELMLAKAIKQKKQGFDVEVNGERV